MKDTTLYNKMTEYVMFWRLTDVNAPLSQWYPSKFIEDDITFNNAEQYMMYHKAILFNDLNIAKKLLNTRCPKTAKALGRQIKNFDEKIWNINRESIIQQGNWLKFSQNKHLKQFMLGCPKKCIFVEASPLDKIYGIGYASTDALSNRKNWGLNLLGKALNITHARLLSE